VPTFAHAIPHALHKVLLPSGPRRIWGVAFALMPQRTHLNNYNIGVRNYLTAVRMRHWHPSKAREKSCTTRSGHVTPCYYSTVLGSIATNSNSTNMPYAQDNHGSLDYFQAPSREKTTAYTDQETSHSINLLDCRGPVERKNGLGLNQEFISSLSLLRF
jgi:hypothetical protein